MAAKTYTVKYNGFGNYHFIHNGRTHKFVGRKNDAETYDESMATVQEVSGIPEDVAALLSRKTMTESSREPMFSVWEDEVEAENAPAEAAPVQLTKKAATFGNTKKATGVKAAGAPAQKDGDLGDAL